MNHRLVVAVSALTTSLALSASATAGHGGRPRPATTTPTVLHIASAPVRGARPITAEELEIVDGRVTAPAIAGSASLDPRLLADLLRTHGVVGLEVPGAVRLSGDWSLPGGTLALRATGELSARDLRLSAPGLRLTLQGEDILLAKDARVDVSDAPGRGGRILISAERVTSHGELWARGRGRIEVEAAAALRFDGPADTGGGVIRLDPRNMIIGATDSNVLGGTSGTALTRSPDTGGDTGFLSATTLVGLLATNDVIVHTDNSGGSATGIVLSTAPTGYPGTPALDATGGDIEVQADVVWSSSHSLWLLAHDDLIVHARVQNGGDSGTGVGGSVVGIAGWDGGTFSGLDAEPLGSGVYGGGSGDAYVLGPPTVAGGPTDASFGSRLGVTVLAARDVRVQGATSSATSNAFAMVGYRSSYSTGPTLDPSGDVRVTAKGTVSVLGGTVGNYRWAQIGHGGCLNNPASGDNMGVLQGNLSGNVKVEAVGAIEVKSGFQFAGAQIGNGGCIQAGATRGDVSGNIFVKGDSILLQMPPASFGITAVMIGNGGINRIGRNITGNVTGDIHVEATGASGTGPSGDLEMDPSGANQGSEVRIGNGGGVATNVTNNATFMRGELGAQSGIIDVIVARDLKMKGGVSSNNNTQIGHGGYILAAGKIGPASGALTVTVGRDAVLRGEDTTNGNPRPCMIGHGGGTRTLAVTTPAGTISAERAAITAAPLALTVGRELRLLAGATQASTVQIGHGSLLWSAASAVSSDLAGATSDLTVQASSIELRGGGGTVGSVSYATIGNGGGQVLFTPTSTAHMGPVGGNVHVTTTGVDCTGTNVPCGALVMVGSPLADNGNYAYIGNGGEPYDTGVGTFGTQDGASGDVAVQVKGETTLVDGPTDFWHLGHLLVNRTPVPSMSGNVSLTTGTLDFTESSSSTSATINDSRFWPQFVFEAPASPAVDYRDNVDGGNVTLRVRGNAGNDGNLDVQQPLTVPAGAANLVQLVSTDDLSMNAALTHNGAAFVDLVADDANATSPAMSPTALFVIGAGGSIAGAGPVRLFAVSPAQFTAGSYVPPSTAFNIWHGDAGAVVGVNFKTTPPSADLAVTKLDTPDPVDAGTDLVYTITVTNNGPGSASNASLSDTLPANTTFVSLASPGGWTCGGLVVGSGGTLTCTHPSLPAGSSVFTLTVHVDGAAPIGTGLFNTATVSSSTPDPNPGNESATANTTISGSSELSISKVDTPDPVVAGANLTYTITATNAGPSVAAAASVGDTLPAGTTFVSLAAPAGWSCSTPAIGSGGAISCSAVPFAPGSGVFTLVVAVAPDVAAGTVLSNTATIFSPAVDPVPGNASGTATTTVATSADLGLTKIDTPDPVTVGANLTYTVTVSNAGPSAAASSTLADTLPAGTTFVSLASPAGWSCTTPPVGAGGMVSCSNGSLAPGNAVFTLVVRVDPALAGGTILSNTASAASTTTDPNPGNESATATTTVRALNYFTVVPCRSVDTRAAVSPNGGPQLGGGQIRTFAIAGACGIPVTAKAVQLNITVVGPAASGTLHVYSGDLTSSPTASVLAFGAGVTRASNAVVALGAGGDVKVDNQSSGQTHLILDVAGYFE